jgi:hypothetical protein
MPMPKIDLPVFEIKLVSVPKPIKFRPFLVKEEKLLLMALQTEEEQTILNTIKQVINNCLVDELDIDSIPIFDIEYLFLNIRARSVGETVDTAYVCRNIVDSHTDDTGEEIQVECKNLMNVTVNLLQIKPPINDLPTKIYMTKDIGMQLSYPTLETFKSIKNLILSEDADQIYGLIFDCTEYVFDSNNVYYSKESSLEEFKLFLESLTQEQFDKILEFFNSLPVIKKEVRHICEKCSFQHDLVLEGLNDFFI